MNVALCSLHPRRSHQEPPIPLQSVTESPAGTVEGGEASGGGEYVQPGRVSAHLRRKESGKEAPPEGTDPGTHGSCPQLSYLL